MSAAALAVLIAERQPCVVLTGAGVSTESGIPDFRSRDGLWAEYDPQDYASIDSFDRDPTRVWQFYGPRLAALAVAEPNAAHLALAELERRGLVQAVITQNIDLLHTRAGSSRVVEVHGSIGRSVCLSCGAQESLAAVLAQLEERPAPLCTVCGAVLKPDVVMFGELLPAAAIDRAYELAGGASLLLVVGSSLEVYPVALLPLEASGFAVVNREPTALDDRAELVVRSSAGEILSGVVAALD